MNQFLADWGDTNAPTAERTGTKPGSWSVRTAHRGRCGKRAECGRVFRIKERILAAHGTRMNNQFALFSGSAFPQSSAGFHRNPPALERQIVRLAVLKRPAGR